ncbi:MAG: ELM1/GtrOC1 family putative glycosyltransferase, partial [Alphaproteobacteria bacterium]
IVATGDSVSMISEASATGKPVYVIELGDEPRRIRRFHENLRAAGITRQFGGTIESWSYAPLEDTARVAAEVRRRMACRGPVG